MKTLLLAAALTLTFGAVGQASAACALTVDTTLSGAGSFGGNTCGKNLSLSPMCGNNNVKAAGTSIIKISPVGPAASFGIKLVSTTSPGFNPELAFLYSDCTASSSSCPVDDTNGSQTVPTAGGGTFATDMNFDSPGAPAAAGTDGYVFVTDLNNESPACGAFTLTVTGTLPVKLQNFSIN